MTGRLYIFLYLVLDLMSDYLVQLFANLVDLKAWKAFSMRSQVGGRCFSEQGNCSSPLTLQQTVLWWQNPCLFYSQTLIPNTK